MALLSNEQAAKAYVIFYDLFSIYIMFFILIFNPLYSLNNKYNKYLNSFATVVIFRYLLTLFLSSTAILFYHSWGIFGKYVRSVKEILSKYECMILICGFICQIVLYIMDYFSAQEDILIDEYREILKKKGYQSIETIEELKDSDITYLIQKNSVKGILFFLAYGAILTPHIKYVNIILNEINKNRIKNKNKNNTEKANENQLNVEKSKENQTTENEIKEEE